MRDPNTNKKPPLSFEKGGLLRLKLGRRLVKHQRMLSDWLCPKPLNSACRSLLYHWWALTLVFTAQHDCQNPARILWVCRIIAPIAVSRVVKVDFPEKSYAVDLKCSKCVICFSWTWSCDCFGILRPIVAISVIVWLALYRGRQRAKRRVCWFYWPTSYALLTGFKYFWVYFTLYIAEEYWPT